MSDQGLKEYFNADELASKLGVTVKAVRRWTALRRLPGIVRLGYRTVRYRATDIEKALLTGRLLTDDHVLK